MSQDARDISSTLLVPLGVAGLGTGPRGPWGGSKAQWRSPGKGPLRVAQKMRVVGPSPMLQGYTEKVTVKTAPADACSDGSTNSHLS